MSLQDKILKKVSFSKKNSNIFSIKKDIIDIDKNLTSIKLYKNINDKYEIKLSDKEYLKMSVKHFY